MKKLLLLIAIGLMIGCSSSGTSTKTLTDAQATQLKNFSGSNGQIKF